MIFNNDGHNKDVIYRFVMTRLFTCVMKISGSGTPMGDPRKISRDMIQSKCLSTIDMKDEKIKCKDFSLVFFNTTEFPYTVIQTACRSLWCHVAMIIMLYDDEVYLMKQIYELNASYHSRYGDIDRRREFEDELELERNDRKKSFQDRYAHLLSEHERQMSSRTINKDRKHANDKKKPYLLDSTMETIPCLVSGSKKAGVKLTLLKERIREYEGPIGINSGDIRDVNSYRTMRRKMILEIIPSVVGIPYEKHLSKFVLTFFHWIMEPSGRCTCSYWNATESSSIRSDRASSSSDVFDPEKSSYIFTWHFPFSSSDGSSMFCSELVGYVFKRVGFLKMKDINEELVALEDLTSPLFSDKWMSYSGISVYKGATFIVN